MYTTDSKGHRGIYCVAVAVPTGLFTLMRGALSVHPSDSVTLAMDLDEHVDEGADPYYVFSMMVGTDQLFDLWTYSEASLPQWIRNPVYRIP